MDTASYSIDESFDVHERRGRPVPTGEPYIITIQKNVSEYIEIVIMLPYIAVVGYFLYLYIECCRSLRAYWVMSIIFVLPLPGNGRDNGHRDTMPG